MPRVGHKEGCQCVVCKVMHAKELKEKPRAPVTEEVPLRTLAVAEKFKYQPNRLVSLNAPVYTYIKYGTNKGMVSAEDIASGDVIRLNENTLVLKG